MFRKPETHNLRVTAIKSAFKLIVHLLENCHNNVIRNMGESKGISSDVKNGTTHLLNTVHSKEEQH